MKKLIVLLSAMTLSGVLCAMLSATPYEAKNAPGVKTAGGDGVDYTIHRNEDPSAAGYSYAYLVDFYNHTDRYVRVTYDYKMESDGRWIYNNSMQIAPAGTPGSSARNYNAGDVGVINMRWEYCD